MAGGQGRRLRPLTCDIPKPMVPFFGRPVLEHQVNLLKKHGITEIGMTLQYLPEKIMDYFADGAKFDIHTRYFIEDLPLGTAGSVKNARDFLSGTFLVLSGDAICDVDLTQAIAYHRQKKAKVTLVLKSVPVPLEYGVVITDEAGRITQFLEKPSWGQVFSDTVNTGIYILEPEILDQVPQDMFYDFSKNLFPELLQQGVEMYGYLSDGYWCDIGDVAQYRQAMADVFEGRCSIEMPREVQQNVYSKGNLEIPSTVRIEPPVYLGHNVRLEGVCSIGPYAVVEDNAVLGSMSSIKHSVLWEDAILGDVCELRGSIVCNDVRLQKNVRAFEGSVIGPGCRVGARSLIKPDVRIWPEKRIPNGSVLSENVVWNPSAQLFTGSGMAGGMFTEITPASVAQLAGAFGTAIGEQGRCAVACSPNPACKALLYAAVSGLCASGVEAVHLETATLPALRYAMGKKNCTAGIYLQGIGDAVQIRMFTADGMDIPLTLERQIQSSLTKADQAFDPHHAADAKPFKMANLSYVQSLSERFYCRDGLEMLVGGPGEEQVRSALYRCGHYPKRFTGEYDAFKREMLDYHHSFGIYVLEDGETFSLFNGKSEPLSRRKIAALSVYCCAFGAGENLAYFPEEDVSVYEQYASKLGIGRSKSCEMDIYFSAAGFACALAKALSVSQKNIDEALADLPDSYEHVQGIPCDAGQIGRIMRSFSQHSTPSQDGRGMITRDDHGSCSVVPDISMPGVVLRASAYEEETAAELMAQMRRQIVEALHGEDIDG